ncbi:hypothetical protein GCWU000325_01671 [Alloprevotella tannerae ATCC 51259]|uniref:Uncharacterized protein n=1 Tax=Alloprevotella tannerae ATCC 51259 TaxID=626522 RepID=C9LHK6_9BACT|nr:hypothetical protein GCWU000325_01671 [Alloprevotella tannerae ATCC 51259]
MNTSAIEDMPDNQIQWRCSSVSINTIVRLYQLSHIPTFE